MDGPLSFIPLRRVRLEALRLASRVPATPPTGELVLFNQAGTLKSMDDQGTPAAIGTIIGLTATAAELNLNDGAVAGTSVASKTLALGANKNTDILALPVSGLKIGAGAGTAVSASAAELNKSTGIPATAYHVVAEELTFTETSGDGTYTGTIALPAGARIIDIGVDGQAVWTAGTSASLKVGDDGNDTGFFTATNLKATDLLAGEINNLEHPGGKAGAYIGAEQRVLYSASARNVIAVLAKVGTGTAGRTRVYCVYAVPTAVAVAKV